MGNSNKKDENFLMSNHCTALFLPFPSVWLSFSSPLYRGSSGCSASLQRIQREAGGTAAPVPAFTDLKPVSEITAPGDGAGAVKQEEWSAKPKEGQNA